MEAEDIRASDEAFRKQFDPNDASYHGGILGPVPIGGSRVPKGLELEHDWQKLPIKEDSENNKVSYGPEYDLVEKTRNELGELKKALSSVNAPVDALAALRAKLATSPDEKVQKSIELEEQKLTKALEVLEAFKSIFPKDSEFGSKGEVIDEVAKAAVLKITTKEEQFEFGTLVKKHTSQIFREQKTLLERMKKLKKS